MMSAFAIVLSAWKEATFNILTFVMLNIYRLLFGRGVPLGHIGTGVAISARGPIWLSSANMT